MARREVSQRRDIARTVERAAAPPVGGCAVLTVRTFRETTYPVAAARVYACRVIDVTFPETEGATVERAPRVGSVIYVGNIGKAIPPEGTDHRAYQQAGRWLMEFNG